jgi:hypothetical protein
MPKWFIYIFFKTKCCVIANVVKQNKNEKAKIEKSFCYKIEKTNIFCFVFLSSKENIGDSFRMLHLALKVSTLK